MTDLIHIPNDHFHLHEGEAAQPLAREALASVPLGSETVHPTPLIRLHFRSQRASHLRHLTRTHSACSLHAAQRRIDEPFLLR